MILTPFIEYIQALYFDFAVNGFVSGGIELCINIWVAEMWGKECGPYLQLVHCVGSISSIITPELFEPFLTADNINKCTDDSVANSSDKWAIISKLYIPYTILGAITIFLGLILGCLYCYKKYNKRKITGDVLKDNKTDTKTRRTLNKMNTIFITEFMPSKAILITIVMCGYVTSIAQTVQWAQFNYLKSFIQFLDLGINETNLSLILAVSFFVSRIIAIPVAYYLSAKYIISASLVLLLTSQILYLTLMTTPSIQMVWAATIVFGVGLGHL
jgi:hypothetical protein